MGRSACWCRQIAHWIALVVCAGCNDVLGIELGEPKPSEAGDLVWLRGFGGSRDDSATDIAFHNGRLAVVGTFTDRIDLGEGPSGPLVLESQGAAAFVASMTADGDVEWARALPAGSIYPPRVRLTDTGVLVGGVFTGAATFGEPGDAGYREATCEGPSDGYAAIFDDDGELRLVIILSGPGSEGVLSLLGNDEVVGMGGFLESDVKLDGIPVGAGAGLSPTAEGRDAMVAFIVLDPMPALALGVQISGPDNYVLGLASADGGIWAAVAFVDTATVVGSGQTFTSEGEYDSLLVHVISDPAQVRQQGQVVVTTQLSGTGFDWAHGMAPASGGGVLLAGESTSTTFSVGGDTALESAGGLDVFLARYDGAGEPVWAQSAGGPGDDFGHLGVELASSVDGACISGRFTDEATFGAGTASEVVLKSAGGGDAFFAEYDHDGQLVWARSAGGEGEELGSGVAYGIDGSLFIAGMFSFDAVFGRGESQETTLTSAGGSDIFVAQLRP